MGQLSKIKRENLKSLEAFNATVQEKIAAANEIEDSIQKSEALSRLASEIEAQRVKANPLPRTTLPSVALKEILDFQKQVTTLRADLVENTISVIDRQLSSKGDDPVVVGARDILEVFQTEVTEVQSTGNVKLKNIEKVKSAYEEFMLELPDAEGEYASAPEGAKKAQSNLQWAYELVTRAYNEVTRFFAETYTFSKNFLKERMYGKSVLDPIMKKLDLDKNNLTASTVRKASLLTHPDRGGTADDATKQSMELLKTVVSDTDLAKYCEQSLAHMVKLAKKDEEFLIEKSIETVRNYKNEDIDPNLVTQVNHFIDLAAKEHKEGRLSFQESLSMISEAMNVLKEPTLQVDFFNKDTVSKVLRANEPKPKTGIAAVFSRFEAAVAPMFAQFKRPEAKSPRPEREGPNPNQEAINDAIISNAVSTANKEIEDLPNITDNTKKKAKGMMAQLGSVMGSLFGRKKADIDILDFEHLSKIKPKKAAKAEENSVDLLDLQSEPQVEVVKDLFDEPVIQTSEPKSHDVEAIDTLSQEIARLKAELKNVIAQRDAVESQFNKVHFIPMAPERIAPEPEEVTPESVLAQWMSLLPTKEPVINNQLKKKLHEARATLAAKSDGPAVEKKGLDDLVDSVNQMKKALLKAKNNEDEENKDVNKP